MPVGAGKYQLGRAGPVGPVRQGRLQAQVRPVGGVDPTPLFEAQQRYRDGVAETKGRDYAQQVSESLQRRLYGDGQNPGILSLQGDPTSHYAGLQNDINQQILGIEDQIKDLPGREKDIIRAHVKQTQIQTNKVMAVNEFQQYKKYETFVNQREVDRRINDVNLEMALQVDENNRKPAGEKPSFERIDQALAGVYEAALRLGPSAETSPEGAMGLAVKGLITNAISTNKFELAKQLMKKYHALIPEGQEAKLNESLSDKEVTIRGAELAERTRGMNNTRAHKEIDKEKNILIRREARRNRNETERNEKRRREQSETDAMNSMTERFYDEEYETFKDARLDPMWDLLSSSDKRIFSGLFKDAPDTSDPKSVDKVLSAFASGEHRLLRTREDFSRFRARLSPGLSEKGKRWLTNKLDRYTSETDSSIRAKVNVANDKLDLAIREISPDAILGRFWKRDRDRVLAILDEQIQAREDDIAKSRDGGKEIVDQIMRDAGEIAKKLDEAPVVLGIPLGTRVPEVEDFAERLRRRQQTDPGASTDKAGKDQINSLYGRGRGTSFNYNTVKAEVTRLPEGIRNKLQNEDGDKRDITAADLADDNLKNYIIGIYRRIPLDNKRPVSELTDNQLKEIWNRLGSDGTL